MGTITKSKSFFRLPNMLRSFLFLDTHHTNNFDPSIWRGFGVIKTWHLMIFASFYIHAFWTPGLSHKIGSVRPSFLPPVLPSVCKFSKNWLFNFLWNLAWCLGPIYSCVWQSRIFWEKFPSCKNDQKRSKMTQKHGFLDFLRKSRH